MTLLTLRHSKPVAVAFNVLVRAGGAVAGAVAIVVGLGLTMTIVLMAAGLALLVGGLLLLVTALFEHPFETPRQTPSHASHMAASRV